MVNRYSPGCGCCGLASADCCNGADFSGGDEITNFTFTRSDTSETWTQNGVSDWRGDDIASPCRFSIPCSSSVSGNVTVDAFYEGSKYTASTQTTPPGSSWRVQNGGITTQFSTSDWVCGDTHTISFSSGIWSGSFDVTPGQDCGCCNADPCPYKARAITNVSLSLGSGTSTQTQNGESRWRYSPLVDYCTWMVPVNDSVSGQTQVRVERLASTGWQIKDYGGLVLMDNTSSTACGGTSISMSNFSGTNTGTMDVTSSGTCPT